MADNGTKRKRDKEPSDTQKKKKKKKLETAASEPPSPIIRIGKVIRPRFPPVIAITPGITIPPDVKFTSYYKSHKSPTNPSAPDELLLYSNDHPTMTYIGREERSPALPPLVRHYIGVLDPPTGELQVVEAKKLVIRGTVRSQQAKPSDMMGWPAKKTTMELKNELGETFGTKKAKKAIRDRAENAISRRKPGDSEPQQLSTSELAMMTSLEETTSQMATREELQATAREAKAVPRGHYDAEDIGDVYIPAEIIGAEILSAIPIRDWQKDLKAGKDLQFTSRFIANRIRRIAARKEPVDGLRLLRYLSWLIKFWNSTKTRKADGTRMLPKTKNLKAIFDSAPDVVQDSIRQKFSDSGVMRKTDVDRLMTHCCVFACLLDNFEVNMLDLREDLKLEQKEIKQYFEEIGAQTKLEKLNGNTEHLAKLALPLVFPKVRYKKKQR